MLVETVRSRWVSKIGIKAAQTGILLASVSAAVIFAATAATARAHVSQPRPNSCDSARIITIGTSGGPEGNASRAQPATLFQYQQASVLVDVGEGTANLLAKSRIGPSAITHVLITHLHFDHTAGLDGLIAFRWLNGREGDAPLVLVGPKGTDRLVKSILVSLEEGEKLFTPMLPGRRSIAQTVQVVELSEPQITAYSLSPQINLSAVRNSHYASLEGLPGGPASQSYSYRLDTACGGVTFTGDTGPSIPLTRLASGSRVLVSEVIDAEEASRLTAEVMGPGVDTAAMIQHMKMHHLSAREVAQMAKTAGVHTVVLTHFVSADGGAMKREVAASFNGEVIAATDGMAIDPW